MALLSPPLAGRAPHPVLTYRLSVLFYRPAAWTVVANLRTRARIFAPTLQSSARPHRFDGWASDLLDNSGTNSFTGSACSIICKRNSMLSLLGHPFFGLQYSYVAD
uniref:Uncharacterized protein n=1 Tax=Ananas comosus var. bracteatus TaxID=296719 RepID=A0A6V7P0R8_ANACO|nr:unnamed protein product [Ananas comosus var. bracteatus]